MIVVYKYELPLRDSADIEMHDGAQILKVDTQSDALVLWAKVDTDRPLSTRRFYIRGTGHGFIGSEGKHLGTAILQGGALVLHVFADF